MARLLVIALIAAAALVGCGSDDNKSSDNTSNGATSTVPVPKGRLGQGFDSCDSTRIGGRRLTYLRVRGMSCDVGSGLLSQYIRNGKLDGYTCSAHRSSRYTNVECFGTDSERAVLAQYTTANVPQGETH